jgi:hypothetical protein
MIYNDLYATHRFITTDIMPGSGKLPVETTGIITHVENTQNNIDVICNIIVIGVANNHSKVYPTTIRVPLLMCQELISTGLYERCDTAILTKPNISNLLKVPNLEFITLFYARLHNAIRLSKSTVGWVSLITHHKTLKEVNDIIKNYGLAYKTLINMVDSVNKRINMLNKLCIFESFVQYATNIALPIVDVLSSHLNMSKQYGTKDLTKELKSVINSKSPTKVLLDHKERKNVLQRYESNNNWFRSN